MTTNSSNLQLDIMELFALLRILQLSSANLPVGGFTYSQGLEWAVEARWVTDKLQTEHWLQLQMNSTLSYCDLPILQRLYNTSFQNNSQQQDRLQFSYWSNFLLSNRETDELRKEELQRGEAFYRFLTGLPDINLPDDLAIKQSQLAGIAWYAASQRIPLIQVQTSWAYSWLESNIMAAIKLVPLGQQAGQQLLFSLSEKIPILIAKANNLTDDELGAGSPITAIASSCHETQYTRLFRS